MVIIGGLVVLLFLGYLVNEFVSQAPEQRAMTNDEKGKMAVVVLFAIVAIALLAKAYL